MKTSYLFILSLVLGCAGAKYDRGVAAFVEAERDVSISAHPAEGDVVTVVVGVRAGSAHDPVGQEGLAWLTAQQLQRSDGLSKEIQGLGGSLSVQVDEELAIFKLEVSQAASQAAVDALGRALSQPDFSLESLAVSKTEGLQWLGDGLSTSPARLAAEAYDLWVYQGHPYGHAPQGRHGVLDTLALDDVTRFYDRRYIRAALSVAHTDNLPEEVAVALQSALSQRPGRLYSDVTPRPVSPVRDIQVMAVIKEGAIPGVYLGHPVELRVGDKDWAALVTARAAIDPDVSLDTLLGGGLLQQTLSLWFSAEPDQSPYALLSEAVDGVSKWVGDGIDQEIFEQAKVRILAQLEQAETDPKVYLEQKVQAVLLRQPDPLSILKTKLDALTLADVNAALAERVDPGALRVVLLADKWEASVEQGKKIGAIHIVDAEGLFR